MSTSRVGIRVIQGRARHRNVHQRRLDRRDVELAVAQQVPEERRGDVQSGSDRLDVLGVGATHEGAPGRVGTR